MKRPLDKQRIVLTDRDINVLYFIFQMRFATSHQIMNAFYSERLDGTEISSDRYIKKRLAQLVQIKALRIIRLPWYNKYIYCITTSSLRFLESQGYKILTNRVPEFRTQNFDHDSRVSDCRIYLEKSGRAKKWVPEFQIQSQYNAFENLPAKYIPDALFINKLDELTAFEMEISRKAKYRYQDKIDKYVDLIRSQFNETIKFKRVLYVTKSTEVYKLLTDMTRIHSDIFKVETFESLGEKL